MLKKSMQFDELFLISKYSLISNLAVKNILTSIDLADCGNTDGRPYIDVSGHGSQSGVVPVFIIRSQLLRNVGFHNINPLRQLNLAGSVK